MVDMKILYINTKCFKMISFEKFMKVSVQPYHRVFTDKNLDNVIEKAKKYVNEEFLVVRSNKNKIVFSSPGTGKLYLLFNTFENKLVVELIVLNSERYYRYNYDNLLSNISGYLDC